MTGYATALDLYFARHDGQAATIEDWLTVFQDATGRDLTQFKRWYSQAGTPRVTVTEDWQAETGVFTLTFAQENPPTPGQPHKDPKLIPIAVGLLNPNGDEVMPTTVLEMTEPVQSFSFHSTPDGWRQGAAGVAASTRPIASILRGFSAPVVLDRAVSAQDRAFLLAHDTDPFNKWEAGRALAKDVLARMIVDGADVTPDWLEALAQVAFDESLDPAFRALCLRLPAEDDMAQTLFAAGHVPDPMTIHAARRRMGNALAARLAPHLPALIASLDNPGPFSAAAVAAGRRSLRLSALGYVSRTDGGRAAEAVFAAASNMTEELGALSCLLDIGRGQAELAVFESKWGRDANVMDKWFALQIAYAPPDRAAAVTDALTRHPRFDWKNPNRFRAVIGALSANHAGYHAASGAGYALVADWLIRLDPLNPQTASRMSTAFETWPRYDADRQALMRGQMQRILATPGLSGDLGEMAGRMLGG